MNFGTLLVIACLPIKLLGEIAKEHKHIKTGMIFVTAFLKYVSVLFCPGLLFKGYFWVQKKATGG